MYYVFVCVLSDREDVSHVWIFFFFQAEDGIRDLVRSRGLGDVYKRQVRRRYYREGQESGVHTVEAWRD